MTKMLERDEKMMPTEEEYPDAEEEVSSIEKAGLEIAKSIQEQSDKFGKKRRYENEK